MKISIIVPVYNVEKELDRCMTSLLAQTYADIEIILIDDGSTDSSSEKCDYYAANNEIVQVVHKPNEGQSKARNIGIDKAQGDYCLFVDSDDFIDTDTCSRFVTILRNVGDNQLDIIVGEYLCIENGKTTHYMHSILNEKTVYTGEDYLKFSIPYNLLGCMPCLYLCRIEFLRSKNLYFLEGYFHEDMEWVIKCFLSKPKVGYLKGTFYNYIIRQGSTTRAFNYSKHTKDILKIYQIWKSTFEGLDDIVLQKLLNGFLVKCYITSCAKYKISKREENRIYSDFLIKNSFAGKEKLKAIVFSAFPQIYYQIYKFTR